MSRDVRRLADEDTRATGDAGADGVGAELQAAPDRRIADSLQAQVNHLALLFSQHARI